MRAAFLTPIALLICTSTALSQGLVAPEGRYLWKCGTGVEWEDADGRLEISGNELRYWEATCTLTNPVDVRGLPNTKIYDGSCEGEGDEWETRIILNTTSHLDLQVVIIINDQGVGTYQSCPD
ncbi:hypothetical protein [Roseibium sp. SCP14]|uniref:hypothetical protein n=1 Tax=Roseibium sp. SCP14 TaxID=3141375 RepID=UPI00333C90D0